MFVQLECCQKCFMHKQYNHQEWVFYENFCKLDQVIQRKCKLKVLKNATLPPLILEEFQRYNFTQNQLIEKLLEQRKLKYKPRIETFQIKYKGLYIFSLLQSKIFPDYDLVAKILLILKKANLNGLNQIEIELKNSEISTIYELAKIKDHNVNQKNIKVNFLQDILIEPNHKRSKVFTSQQKRLPRKQSSLKSLKRGLSQPKINLSKQNFFVFKKKQENGFLLKPHTAESYEGHSRRSMQQKGGYSSVSIQPLFQQSQGSNKKKLQRQIRCKRYENRYSNINRKSQTLTKLPLKEYNKLRQQKFQYLTKQSDVNCDYSADLHFQLQNLTESEGEDEDRFKNSYGLNRFNSLDLIDEFCRTQMTKTEQQRNTLIFQQKSQQKFNTLTDNPQKSQASIYSHRKQTQRIVRNEKDEKSTKKTKTEIKINNDFNLNLNNEQKSQQQKMSITDQNRSFLQEKDQKQIENNERKVQDKTANLTSKIKCDQGKQNIKCEQIRQNQNNKKKNVEIKKQENKNKQKLQFQTEDKRQITQNQQIIINQTSLIDNLDQIKSKQISKEIQHQKKEKTSQSISQKEDVYHKKLDIIKNRLKTQTDYFNYFSSCLQDFNTKILSNKANQSIKPSQDIEMSSVGQFFNKFYTCPRMILQTGNKKKVIKMIKNLIEQYLVEKKSNKQWLQISSLNICKIFFISKNQSPSMVDGILYNWKDPTKTKFYISDSKKQVLQLIQLELVDKQFSEILFLFFDCNYQLKKCQLQIGSQNSKDSQEKSEQLFSEKFNVQMRRNESHKQMTSQIEQESYHTFISLQMDDSQQKNSVIQTCRQYAPKFTQPKIKIKVIQKYQNKQNIQGNQENVIGQIQNKGNFFFQLSLELGSYLCTIDIIYPKKQTDSSPKKFNLIFYSQADIQIGSIGNIKS